MKLPNLSSIPPYAHKNMPRTTATWLDRWDSSLMPSYATPKVVLESGRGALVFDVEGKQYIDLLAGIAVNVLGHAHPAVVAAITKQANLLGHVSNTAATPVGIELAECLLGHLNSDGRVFFCNSGAEANEAAFKLARLTGKEAVVSMSGSFHGRTMGALSLTGQPAKREPFEPLVPGVRFAEFADANSVSAAIDPEVGAVFVEPIQGEAGVVVPPRDFLASVQRAARARGALLVVDEVQSGMGRTGSWFAYQNPSVAEGEIAPDVVTLAKGLGGGVPIGACLVLSDTAPRFSAGQHGSTFGANPIACAAALAVFDTVDREDLLPRATALGQMIQARLNEIAPKVREVRGVGLLQGVVLKDDSAKEVETRCLADGVLLNAATPNVVRLAPPLVISDGELSAALDVLVTAIDRSVK